MKTIINKGNVIFRLNNDIIMVENDNLTLDEIDDVKWYLSNEFNVDYDDIDIQYLKRDLNISEYEVNSNGELINRNKPNVKMNRLTFNGDINNLLDSIIDKNLLDNVDISL